MSIDPKILAAAVQTTALTYSVDDTVYESGAPAQFVYVVKKGALRRVKLLPRSRRLILQFLLRGDGFGYGLGRLHRDTVQALTSTELVVASRKALMTAATSDARLSSCCSKLQHPP
jgi:CRP-like cAMP-binding protein